MEWDKNTKIIVAVVVVVVVIAAAIGIGIAANNSNNDSGGGSEQTYAKIGHAVVTTHNHPTEKVCIKDKNGKDVSLILSSGTSLPAGKTSITGTTDGWTWNENGQYFYKGNQVCRFSGCENATITPNKTANKVTYEMTYDGKPTINFEFQIGNYDNIVLASQIPRAQISETTIYM